MDLVAHKPLAGLSQDLIDEVLENLGQVGSVDLVELKRDDSNAVAWQHLLTIQCVGGDYRSRHFSIKH